MLLGGSEKAQKCSTCNRSHPGKRNKAKITAVVQSAEKTDKACPVCGDPAHKYKMRSGSEGTSRRIKDCPAFKSATDQQKQELIKKIKQSHPVCSKFSSWGHQDELCT